MGEDVPYTIASILNSSKIKAINDELYLYRISEISMTEINYKKPSVEKIYEVEIMGVRPSTGAPKKNPGAVCIRFVSSKNLKDIINKRK